MAPPGVRGASCRDWDRGLDCGFREDRFHIVAAWVWGASVLLYVPLTARLARENARWARPAQATGLVTLASALRGLDHVVYLRSDGTSGYGTFMGPATVLIVLALNLVVALWADVVRTKPQAHEAERWLYRLQGISRGVVVVQVPTSIYNSFQVSHGWGYGDEDTWPVDFDRWVPVYAGVGICTMGVGLSVVAVLMYRVSVHLRLQGSSLHTVVLINLAEQVVYDVFYILIAVLYFIADFDANGIFQAIVYYLGHLVGLWVMHAQIIAFFFVCREEDPFRSEDQLAKLLDGGQAGKAEDGVSIGRL